MGVCCKRIVSIHPAMSRLPVIVAACAVLAACAGQEPVPEQASEQVSEPAPQPAADVQIPERAFPEDSLYHLLVAEFGLRRRAYDVSLDRYLTQSSTLRDPGVSAHATHLAQYLQDEKAILESARLWVELEPDNLEARNILARQLVRSGYNAQALPHLAAIQRRGHPANFPILLNEFSSLPASERTDLMRGIEELATEFPDNTSLLLTLALAHHELGRNELALSRLERLFEQAPDQPQALLLEAKIRADEGDENPYARVERVLKEEPDNRTLRLRYARLLTATDMRAAREQFEILARQSPDDGDLLFSLALINREIGDAERASAYLRQLLELGERIDEAHYYLGRIEEERNNPEKAISHYQAVEVGQEYMAANNRVGEILLDSGQVKRSRDWFERQRGSNPDQRDSLFGLEAELLARAGAPEKAMDLLDNALRETPGSEALLYARAMLHEQQGDLLAMEADLRAILAADPDNATALNALGYTLANRTRRYDEALSLVSRALALQPNEPAILDSMGWVLYRMGRYEEALGYLERAYAEFPDPEVAAHLGEVMWTLGNTEAARDVWRTAALREPDHPVLRDTLERLGIDNLDLPSASPAKGEQGS